MTMNNTAIERELGWDDTITKESDFVLLPEGDYDFIVESFERGRHNGSGKLPACNKAVVKIKILGQDIEQTIEHQLFLHSSTEGMLSAFFSGIGMKKKGEPLRMNWPAIVFAKGRCQLGIREYNGNKYNQIKKFYPYETKNNTSETTYVPGKF